MGGGRYPYVLAKHRSSSFDASVFAIDYGCPNRMSEKLRGGDMNVEHRAPSKFVLLHTAEGAPWTRAKRRQGIHEIQNAMLVVEGWRRGGIKKIAESLE